MAERFEAANMGGPPMDFKGRGLSHSVFELGKHERNMPVSMSLLMRTGPREWDIKGMYRIKALGLRGHVYDGVTDNRSCELRCPGEGKIFSFLVWQCVKPED
jgi:hypothetical protein